MAVALVLVLPACGGGEASTRSGTTTERALTGALPRVAEGVRVPEALSDFACERDDEGTWTATGSVTNRTKAPATFQVTVYVGPADGAGSPARTKRISAVQKNGSVGFEIDGIEARAPEGPCHVRVLALPS